MPHQHYTINYIEFPSSDKITLEAVKTFYGEVFGWRFRDWGDSYAESDSSGPGVGFDAGKDRVDSPLAVIYAEDLLKAYVSVQVAGGNISREIFDFPGGRRFHFVDPAGNKLAVWSDK